MLLIGQVSRPIASASVDMPGAQKGFAYYALIRGQRRGDVGLLDGRAMATGNRGAGDAEFPTANFVGHPIHHRIDTFDTLEWALRWADPWNERVGFKLIYLREFRQKNALAQGQRLYRGVAVAAHRPDRNDRPKPAECDWSY
jgi:hypothetical protein